ncbi:MAG: cytochrome c biogenesis protein [Planctomycetota bacterium]
MPLDTYARQTAVLLTGRTRWSGDRGPETFREKEPIDLLCELMFRPAEFSSRQIIAVEHRPFKRLIGLDPLRKFFLPGEIMSSPGLVSLLQDFDTKRQRDPTASPLPDEKRALDLAGAVNTISRFQQGEPMAIVPRGDGEQYLRAGPTSGDPGTERVVQALAALRSVYLSDGDTHQAALGLRDAIDATGVIDPADASNISLEVFYNDHKPWRKTAVLYGLSIVLFGLAQLFARRLMLACAIVAGLAGVGEHILGISLRVAILDRAPVSNTYESLLWMGLVGIAVAIVAQIFNKKSWYLFAGVCAALVSVLFAGLVPLADQSNALPAVLRSNFWLIIHVLTIVASYGVLAVASVLGHVYLIRNVLLRKGATESQSAQSDPLIRQTYRSIQIGLVLLTAGTILGGVWAADSWGRFWGWDPKETWALISIVIYFAVLHARHIRWIKDFGLAAWSVLSFIAIVWTFYGVNYVMASGLHSYGFGSGGELWVGLWALGELVLLAICFVRHRSHSRARGQEAGREAQKRATRATPITS